MQEEIWKDVVGFEDRYSVSSFGRIYSKRSKLFMSSIENRGGYLTFNAKKNGAAINLRIHRVVAIAFLPEPPEELVLKCEKEHHGKVLVNHINGIKSDNRVENLEWSDMDRNAQHAYDAGLSGQKKGIEFSTASVKDMSVIIEIRETYIPKHREFGASALARRFNISRSAVWGIVNNRTYKD